MRCLALLWTILAAEAAPLKVFLLLGSSNQQASLEDLDELIHGDCNLCNELRENLWFAYEDRTWPNIYVKSRDRVGPMSIGDDVGVEIGMSVLFDDEQVDEPLLIVKEVWEGQSLAIDFRPPSSKIGAREETGQRYVEMMNEIQDTLGCLGELVPKIYDESEGYKIVGAVWMGDEIDYQVETHLREYELNLANLLRDIRADLGVLSLPIAIGALDVPHSGNPWQTEMEQMRGIQKRVVADAEFAENTFLVRPEFRVEERYEEYHAGAYVVYQTGKAYGAALLGHSTQVQRQLQITPSTSPSLAPSVVPSAAPSVVPSVMPSAMPSLAPSVFPSAEPSAVPSSMPSVAPSPTPAVQPPSTPSPVAPTTATPVSLEPSTSGPVAGGTPTFSPTTTAPVAGGTPTLAPTTTAPVAGGTPTLAPTTTAPVAGGTPTLAPSTTAPVAGDTPTLAPTTTAPVAGGTPTLLPTTTAPVAGGTPTLLPTTAAPVAGGTSSPTTEAPFTEMPTVMPSVGQPTGIRPDRNRCFAKIKDACSCGLFKKGSPCVFLTTNSCVLPLLSEYRVAFRRAMRQRFRNYCRP